MGLGVVLVVYSLRYRQRLVEKDKAKRKVEELLAEEEVKSTYAILKGQDSERERLAHDLHDRMGGQLSTLQVYIDLLAGTELNSEQKKLIDKLEISSKHAIREVRAIAHDMNHSALANNGLQKALEELFQAINDSKRVKITYHFELNEEVESRIMRDMYQVVQELLNNTLRHSYATGIHLEMTSFEDELNVIYEDNGKGFNKNKTGGGIGLSSIALRVEKYDGDLTIDSEIGRGSSFIIAIPLKN